MANAIDDYRQRDTQYVLRNPQRTSRHVIPQLGLDLSPAQSAPRLPRVFASGVARMFSQGVRNVIGFSSHKSGWENVLSSPCGSGRSRAAKHYWPIR